MNLNSIHEWFYYMSIHLKQILFGIKLTIKLTDNLQDKKKVIRHIRTTVTKCQVVQEKKAYP